MRKFIALLAFISSCGFGYQAWESYSTATLLSSLASVIVFLTAIANLKSSKSGTSKINQVVGDNSQGIQVGGNMSINNKDEK
jgi:hypothetical protein